MEMKSFTVETGEGGKTSGPFLASRESLFQGRFYKSCAWGKCDVNGERQLKTGYRVKEGQKIEVHVPAPEVIDASPENIPWI